MLTTYAAGFATMSPIASCSFVFGVVGFIIDDLKNKNKNLITLQVQVDKKNSMKFPFVTNFIQSYLHQFFDDSHGLKASLKPLRRPFDQYQSRLEAINDGRDIRQINW